MQKGLKSFQQYFVIISCDIITVVNEKRGRTTDGEIGPVDNQINEIGIVQFLLHEYLEGSPNCVYVTKIHCW